MAFTDTADVFCHSSDPSNDRIIFGTAVLGSTFGQIKSASLKRTADEDLIRNNKGSIRAWLLKAPRFELEFKAVLSANVALPGLMEPITFPLAGVSGRIAEITPEWDEDGVRMVSITAKYWDSLAGGTATKWDGSTHTSMA